MQFSTLALIAASLAPAMAQTGSDWLTYTKNLGSTTIIVTNYVGTSTELTGTEWATQTVVVSENGVAAYTKINTYHVSAGAEATTSAAAETTTSAEETTSSSAAAETTSSSAAAETTTSAEETTSAAAETTSAEETTSAAASSSAAATSSEASVETYSGAAAKVGFSLGALAMVGAALI